MTRYFCGNSLAHFSHTSPLIVENTTAGVFDSAYVPSCIIIPATVPTDYMETTAFSATGTIWIRFTLNNGYNGSVANGNGPLLLNGTIPIFKMSGTGPGNWRFDYWNGSTYIATGVQIPMTVNSNIVWTMKIVLNTSFELYSEGTLVASGAGWTGGSTTATRFRVYNTSSGGNFYVSEVMIADYDIRNSHYDFTGINGNSLVNTGGTGTYTDVNETVLNDSTAITVATVANKMGQTKAALAVPGGYRIAAMVIGARGRATGGTVVDGKLGIRTAGGSNNSGSALGYNTGYEPRERIIDNDPDTGVPFLQAGYNGAEVFEEAA